MNRSRAHSVVSDTERDRHFECASIRNRVGPDEGRDVPERIWQFRRDRGLSLVTLESPTSSIATLCAARPGSRSAMFSART